jgi:hypothetical protein
MAASSQIAPHVISRSRPPPPPTHQRERIAGRPGSRACRLRCHQTKAVPLATRAASMSSNVAR